MEVHIPLFDLALTAASGQCFRFHKIKDGFYQLTAKGQVLHIQELGDKRYSFSCDEAAFETHWVDYFDLKRDYGAVHSLIRPQDGYLYEAMRYAQGVKILRQEPFETLMAFIISQRKSIPAIISCVEALSRRFGEQILEDVFAFPKPAALANASEEDLKACGLGYRVPYIKKTAQMVDGGQIDLEEIATLSDSELETELLRFPGVGKKVAACVMLFAFGRLDIFPVDTWIQKVLSAQYQDGFPFSAYPGVSGILQQYLFCYARNQAGRL